MLQLLFMHGAIGFTTDHSTQSFRSIKRHVKKLMYAYNVGVANQALSGTKVLTMPPLRNR